MGSEVELALVRYPGRCMQAPEIQSQCSTAICPNFLGLPQSHTVCALSTSIKLSPAYCPALGQTTAMDTENPQYPNSCAREGHCSPRFWNGIEGETLQPSWKLFPQPRIYSEKGVSKWLGQEGEKEEKSCCPITSLVNPK